MPKGRDDQQFPEELTLALRSAAVVTVLTGSGVSAESGIPTFREAQSGLWSQYNPQSLATPEAFYQNPRLVWEWYTWRRELIQEAKPNEGHESLLTMEKFVEHFNLITQNVDGLHQQAGSSDVIELHGNILRSKCTFDGETFYDIALQSDNLPGCPSCGNLLRPDVVWFGESLPADEYRRAVLAAQNCDVFFSIGTSGVVQPAASLAHEARHYGSLIVEINLDDTPLSSTADFTIHGPSGTVLPDLIDAAFRE